MQITRRTLLKQIAAGSVISAPVGLYSTDLFAAEQQAVESVSSASATDDDLQITFFFSTAVPVATLLVRNPQTKPLSVNNFTPGTITMGDYFFEIVQSTGISQTKPLVLEPGQMRSYLLPVQKLNGTSRSIEGSQYIQLDNLAEAVSDDALLVQTGGNIYRDRVVVRA